MNNITIVTRNLRAGGAERVIVQLANYFVSNDIKCTIVTMEKKELFYQLDNRVTLHQIENRYKGLINKINVYYRMRKYVTKAKPDIVLSMPEEIGIYVLTALIGARLPIVVSERNNPKVMPWKKSTRLLRRLMYPLAAGFIFQTQEAADYFPKRIKEKSIVLPNPLDLKRIPEKYSGELRKEVVSAGRLEPQKNFFLLIKAFAIFVKKNPEYKLVIYGDGSQREQLEKLAVNTLPPSSFEFPGKTNDLLNKINGASMFVLSSNYEGMPNVLIEAMAMGMPVISTDCPAGGPRELIKHNYNGLLTPVKDVDMLSKQMESLIISKELSNNLSFRAVEIKNELNSDIISKKWEIFLEKSIN